MTDRRRNFNAKFGIFDDNELDIRLAKWLRQRSTTRNCSNGSRSVYTNCHFRLSVIVAITLRHFIRARHGRKSRTSLAIGISAPSVAFPYNYFWFWSTYRYFRLSFDVTVTCWHFQPARPGRKPQVCRRNCNDICHTVRDISTCGLDDHIAISSFPSVSEHVSGAWAADFPLTAQAYFCDTRSPLRFRSAHAPLTCSGQCRTYLWTLSLSLEWSKRDQKSGTELTSRSACGCVGNYRRQVTSSLHGRLLLNRVALVKSSVLSRTCVQCTAAAVTDRRWRLSTTAGERLPVWVQPILRMRTEKSAPK